MKEKWKVYDSKNVPKGDYYLESLVHNNNGLIIKLENDYLEITIDFRYLAIVTRFSNDSQRWRTIDSLLYEYGKNFFENNPLFIVENSNFIEWLEVESFGVNGKEDVTHYCVVTPDDMIDILALNPPEILSNKLEVDI